MTDKHKQKGYRVLDTNGYTVGTGGLRYCQRLAKRMKIATGRHYSYVPVATQLEMELN